MQLLTLFHISHGDFMKIDSKNIFLLGFLGLGIYFCFHFKNKNDLDQSQGIILSALAKPKFNLPSCYPSGVDGPPLEQYSVQRKGAKYTLFIASQLNNKSQVPSLEIILTKERIEGICQFLNKRDQSISLLAYVSQEIAVNLVKQQFNKSILKYGLKTFQDRLENIQAPEGPDPFFYFTEQAIALQELGLKFQRKQSS